MVVLRLPASSTWHGSRGKGMLEWDSGQAATCDETAGTPCEHSAIRFDRLTWSGGGNREVYFGESEDARSTLRSLESASICPSSTRT